MKYINTMELTYLNLATGINHTETHNHYDFKPLISTEQDLFDNTFTKVDFSCKSWDYFKCILKGITDKNDKDIHLKVERTIKRKLKGTSKGMQIAYRDEHDLIQHVVVRFKSSIEFF